MEASRYQQIKQRLRQLGYVPEKMSAIEQNDALLEAGDPLGIEIREGESLLAAVARLADNTVDHGGKIEYESRYATHYDEFMGYKVSDTEMTFWVGCKEGDLHGGPVRRHLTSCYRPAKVYDAGHCLVFKGNALSDTLYVVPECEYWALHGPGMGEWVQLRNDRQMEERKRAEKARNDGKVTSETENADPCQVTCSNSPGMSKRIRDVTKRRVTATKKRPRETKSEAVSATYASAWPVRHEKPVRGDVSGPERHGNARSGPSERKSCVMRAKNADMEGMQVLWDFFGGQEKPDFNES